MASETAGRPRLQPEELAKVKSILAQLLPGRRVWIFGSRATGKNLWRWSDLDLAVEGKLTWPERGVLDEAFDESNLPMKVDVLELALVDAEFLDRIRADFLPVQTFEEALQLE